MSVNFGSNHIKLTCNKYVTINNAEEMPNNTTETLERASGVMGQYAKSKNAQISITPKSGSDSFYITTLSKDSNIVSCPIYSNDLSKNVKLSKKIGSNTVSTSIIHANEKSDKPFLRRVYEQLQYMIEGRESRIDEMKKETLIRLKQIGKIK